MQYVCKITVTLMSLYQTQRGKLVKIHSYGSISLSLPNFCHVHSFDLESFSFDRTHVDATLVRPMFRLYTVFLRSSHPSIDKLFNYQRSWPAQLSSCPCFSIVSFFPRFRWFESEDACTLVYIWIHVVCLLVLFLFASMMVENNGSQFNVDLASIFRCRLGEINVGSAVQACLAVRTSPSPLSSRCFHRGSGGSRVGERRGAHLRGCDQHGTAGLWRNWEGLTSQASSRSCDLTQAFMQKRGFRRLSPREPALLAWCFLPS